MTHNILGSEAIMATVTMADALTIVRNCETITLHAKVAVMKHGEKITAEIAAFSTVRESDPDGWAKLCLVKSILSPGAKLDANIAAAHSVLSHIHETTPNFDTVKEWLTGLSYGSQCYGNNVRAIIASWRTIQSFTAESCTLDGLLALSDANVLRGLGQKTRNWTVALFGDTNVAYTLDRHMLRGLCATVGIDRGFNPTCSAKVYDVLATLMLEVHAGLFPDANPLLSQWAIWNEFRHADAHASHLSLVS